MTLFKCKMCGGDLEIAEGVTIAECEYCGTKQTVPKAMDENLQNLFNRANTLRIKSEFDKAEKLYEKIIQADTTQSEAYWGLILCKYGIEYVDDPATFKKIPTCHRASYDSIIADDDYKSAIENADMSQRAIYEKQAKEIDRIQKEILALAQKEECYDVFICYKETDADGKRTQDSVIANDIYYQLTGEGLKVFYAAITLEGKLGSAYEPIIFAALNSAKVMLAIGTRPEHFNAVWVKNEWSRYLKIVQKDRSKLLIPCYRDMDAYELPEEFAHLQAQDMSKIGFINDIVRGIQKVLRKDEPKQTVIKETVITGANTNIAPLLKRAFIFLEDGDFNSANEYCEKVLDQDPENGQAYLGKLMADLKIKRRDNLRNCPESFENNPNYLKVVRFGDDVLKNALAEYLHHIYTRNKNAQTESAYHIIVNAMKSAKSEEEYRKVAKSFEAISEYKDASLLASQCLEKAEAEKRKAEEKRQKAEEERRKIEEEKEREKRKTEEEKKLCEALFAELELTEKNQKSIENAKSELTSLTAEHDRLTRLKDDWPQIEESINSLNNRIEAIQAEISKLHSEKSSLGFFAGKKKKDISQKITDFEGDVSSLKRQFESLSNKKEGYNSLSDIYPALIHIERKIDDKRAELDKLSSTKSSQEIRAKLEQYAYGAKLLYSHKIGSIIKFGTYQQNDTAADIKQKIEWLVLDVRNQEALVISKYALDCKPYNHNDMDVTWETCTLRRWLNNEFINLAFSAKERAMIHTVTVTPDSHPIFNTSPGNATQDKIFLLSAAEATEHFESDNERQCKPTDFAIANGASTLFTNHNCCWWLRSPGTSQSTASIIDGDGNYTDYVLEVYKAIGGIRPAMWINLEVL